MSLQVDDSKFCQKFVRFVKIYFNAFFLFRFKKYINKNLIIISIQNSTAAVKYQIQY